LKISLGYFGKTSAFLSVIPYCMSWVLATILLEHRL